jgi:hypothetical protein
MQGLNRSFAHRTYCKKKETRKERYHEANTHTNMQGKLMKKMIRKNSTQKIQQLEGFLATCKNSTVRPETQEESETNQTHPANTKPNQ